MGGHGGLNILPQKRWNVYNFDNREKVRKDEEEAAREEAIRQQKAKREETEFKLEKLRQAALTKRRRLEPGTNGRQDEGAIVVRETVAVEGTLVTKDEVEKARHINLFAEFEAREKEGKDMVQEKEKDMKYGSKGKKDRNQYQDHKDRQLEKKDGKPTGEPADEKYRLGHGALGKTGKKPWYMIKTFMVERSKNEKRERSDTRVHVSAKVDDKSHKSSNSKKSLEDLRAERRVREQEEREKARRVVIAKAGSSMNNGYTRLADGRVPHYHASFGNAR